MRAVRGVVFFTGIKSLKGLHGLLFFLGGVYYSVSCHYVEVVDLYVNLTLTTHSGILLLLKSFLLSLPLFKPCFKAQT